MGGRGSVRLGRTVTVFVMWMVAAPLRADVVTIAPEKDNTLYEDTAGALSNGLGQHVFSGRSGITTGTIRRAVLSFDVAGNIPAGATIESATLTLHLSMAPFSATSQPYDLYRLVSAWGEGSSDAAFQEGGGTAATTGDATWLHTSYRTQFWAAPGGDFTATVTASRSVGDILGFYSWGPTPRMQTDVQAWLDDPSSNFGWILRGIETQLQTARRFDSLQNPEPTFRPLLTVQFSASATGAGRVPDGRSIPGAPVTVDRGPGGQITLRWGDSCLVGDDDYEIYEGVVGDFTSHQPLLCSTAGATTVSVTPSVANGYYLVVPRNAAVEGSYGTDSALAERPRSKAACRAQSIVACL